MRRYFSLKFLNHIQNNRTKNLSFTNPIECKQIMPFEIFRHHLEVQRFVFQLFDRKCIPIYQQHKKNEQKNANVLKAFWYQN